MYFQTETIFNGVYSRNDLQKIKDGTYVINLDEFKSMKTHWIALCKWKQQKYILRCNIFR